MRTVVALAVLVGACSSPPMRPVGHEPIVKPPGGGPPAAWHPDETAPGFRLPTGVRPVRGALELTIVPDHEHFTGVARYQVALAAPTDVVWLDAVGLDIDTARVNGADARIVRAEGRVGLAGTAPLTGEVAIEIAYRGAIARDASVGLYADHEGADWYAYTFFEAIDARRAFPCFDEPGFKIPWTLSFHVRKADVALGNAAVVSEVDEPAGMKRVTLAESKPLPSYLVAFVVGPFELVDGGAIGRARTPLRFIVPRGRTAETRYAREVTPKVVAALEDYFDMDYPYGKLDVAVVPRYWGTMEHPGIVAMGQPLTLIPPDQETSARKRAYANILAHELAHYWFGDLVTMAWWDDTWLNESLASWLDVKITDAIDPSWSYYTSSVGNVEEAMASDELPSARAMRQAVEDADGIQASFDNSTTYAKGAAVLDMFEQWIGPDQFRTFIRQYLAAHAWGNATADDFVGALTAVAPAAGPAFRSFLEQPGAPLITAAVRCEGGHGVVALHQRRSLPAGVTVPGAAIWQVPVCIRAGRGQDAGTTTCTLLAAADGELALPGPCPTWAVADADGHGYYRATLTGVAPPPSARLTARERLRSVGEVAAAHDRGDVGIDAVLATAVAMASEPDPRAAAWAVGLLYTAGPDRLDDGDHARFVRMFGKVWGARARKLGWTRRAGDDDDLHRLRLQIVPALVEAIPALRGPGIALARKALQDPASVPDDVAGPALAVAARYGDRALFDQVLAAAKATPDRRLRGRYLATLAVFRDPALAADARALMLGADFDQRESRVIAFVQLQSRYTRDAAWAWVLEHLPAALSVMRDDEAAGLLGFLAGVPCDQARRDQVAALVTPLASKYDGAVHATAQGLDAADRCIARTQRDAAGVHAFLAKY